MTRAFSYVWLLPLLERPCATVMANLAEAVAELGIEAPLPDPLSLREVLLSALCSGSPYWPQCASRWLEQGFPLDPELCQTLLEQVRAKAFEQSTGHRLGALARRWQRQHLQGH
ncbi:hypothetical protein AO265_34345 [Pseudomonas sp. ABAC61]|nr:hypothetical protein AO265_34345 [Pseudomonas sp. ABAC61]